MVAVATGRRRPLCERRAAVGGCVAAVGGARGSEAAVAVRGDSRLDALGGLPEAGLLSKQRQTVVALATCIVSRSLSEAACHGAFSPAASPAASPVSSRCGRGCRLFGCSAAPPLARHLLPRATASASGDSACRSSFTVPAASTASTMAVVLSAPAASALPLHAPSAPAAPNAPSAPSGPPPATIDPAAATAVATSAPAAPAAAAVATRTCRRRNRSPSKGAALAATLSSAPPMAAAVAAGLRWP